MNMYINDLIKNFTQRLPVDTTRAELHRVPGLLLQR